MTTHRLYLKIAVILLLGLHLVAESAQCQDPSFWQLTDEDGLPSLTIYPIIQDDQGYIWMGTANGLCKYNGHSIETFTDPSLNDNEIIEIASDPWGRIWCVNLSGQVFYLKDGNIHLPHIMLHFYFSSVL